MHQKSEGINLISLALVQGARHCPSTRYTFLKSLETTVILVRVTEPYITELRESLQSSVQQLNKVMSCTLSKVGKPYFSVSLLVCVFFMSLSTCSAYVSQ